MLFPLGGIPAVEYDATFTISPTSRFGHASDTVLASVEALVRNDGSERIAFPFMVLSTDSGEGATEPASVEPKVLNGSQPVTMEGDEVDEVQAAEHAVQRVAAGGGDETAQRQAREFVLAALRSAERRQIGSGGPSPSCFPNWQGMNPVAGPSCSTSTILATQPLLNIYCGKRSLPLQR